MRRLKLTKWSLILSLAILFPFGIAACDDNNEESDPIQTDLRQGIVTESQVSFTHNGSIVTRNVRIIETNIRGEFQLELWSADNELLNELDLNAAFEEGSISFSEENEFTIAFEDYNDDGYPEFSIGQPHSLNYYTYNLYTLKNDQLKLIHQGLVTNQTRYSIAFEKAGNTSFWDRYVDNVYGYEVNNLYTWHDDRFLLTECEGCMMPIDGKWDGTLGVLTLREEQTSEGFTLVIDGDNNAYIKSTHLSPPNMNDRYAIHTIRRSISTELETTFQYDIVVVNPNTGDHRTFRLTQEISGDLYQADSIVGVYGFLDAEHLVYVGITENESRSNGYTYQVSKINILTGTSTVIVAELPDIAHMDSFGPGWLNHGTNTLVLNSYSGGQLWTIDLKQGSFVETPGFEHSWPFHLTVPSPDGERFWYIDYDTREYQYYDNHGVQLAHYPFAAGYEKFPFFMWSPDSSYSVHQSTLEQAEEHIINGEGEYYLIAPQHLKFYDSKGMLTRAWTVPKDSEAYIEVAGWLDLNDDTALLHQYQLSDIKEHGSRLKLNSQYILMNIQTGQQQMLRQVEHHLRDELTLPARSSEAYQPLYLVDIQNGTISVSPDSGSWVETDDPTLGASYTVNYENDILVFTLRDSVTSKVVTKDIMNIRTPLSLIGREWLVGSDMRYIRMVD